MIFYVILTLLLLNNQYQNPEVNDGKMKKEETITRRFSYSDLTLTQTDDYGSSGNLTYIYNNDMI